MQIIGHRGAAGIEPENTIPSFQKAIDLGVSRVECDIHLTADGHLAIIHDETVDRTTNGSGRVSSYSLSELRELDAGNANSVPTLDEVLQLVSDGGIGVHIELKGEGTESRVLDALGGYRNTVDIILTSFDAAKLQAVRALDSSIRLEHLFYEPGEDALDRAQGVGADGMSVHHQFLTRELVEKAHALRLIVVTWTVNDLDGFHRVSKTGVDFVCTDRPDIMLHALYSLRVKTPPHPRTLWVRALSQSG